MLPQVLHFLRLVDQLYLILQQMCKPQLVTQYIGILLDQTFKSGSFPGRKFSPLYLGEKVWKGAGLENMMYNNDPDGT